MPSGAPAQFAPTVLCPNLVPNKAHTQMTMTTDKGMAVLLHLNDEASPVSGRVGFSCPGFGNELANGSRPQRARELESDHDRGYEERKASSAIAGAPILVGNVFGSRLCSIFAHGLT